MSSLQKGWEGALLDTHTAKLLQYEPQMCCCWKRSLIYECCKETDLELVGFDHFHTQLQAVCAWSCPAAGFCHCVSRQHNVCAWPSWCADAKVSGMTSGTNVAFRVCFPHFNLPQEIAVSRSSLREHRVCLHLRILMVTARFWSVFPANETVKVASFREYEAAEKHGIRTECCLLTFTLCPPLSQTRADAGHDETSASAQWSSGQVCTARGCF